MSRKRRLSEDDVLNKSDYPPSKKLKLDLSNDEEKKEETKQKSFIQKTMECEQFLSIISSLGDDDKQSTHNKLSNVNYLILTCKDNMNYDEVFVKYLKNGKFEKIMPNLTKIETYSNFLFNELYQGISHSKLQEILFTDCFITINMNSVNKLIINYPSLTSIHCYCFYINNNKKTFSNKLVCVNLLSHIPSVKNYPKNMELSEFNNKYKLNIIHKLLPEKVIDPRCLVNSLEIYIGKQKDFRKEYCDQFDCKQDHISVVDEMRCPWCSIFVDRTDVMDPKDVIIKNGIKYRKEIEQHDDDGSPGPYLLQFPIGRFDNEHDLYFDGNVFWSGMPDEPDPEFGFQDTKLFKQKQREFKEQTVYYLTNKECDLLHTAMT